MPVDAKKLVGDVPVPGGAERNGARKKPAVKRKTRVNVERDSVLATRREDGERQDRARVTRQRLMDAAREVFARDGFELARLEDIASVAGRTRGALYAHFEDKADLFFAIFEQDLVRDQEHLERVLVAGLTVGERLDRLVEMVCAKLGDRRRMLLSVEFKMYAVRHPHRQRRLAELHAAMCLRCVVADAEGLLSDGTPLSDEERRAQFGQFGALMDGLALQRIFDPTSLTEEQAEQQVRASLRVALGMPCSV